MEILDINEIDVTSLKLQRYVFNYDVLLLVNTCMYFNIHVVLQTLLNKFNSI